MLDKALRKKVTLRPAARPHGGVHVPHRKHTAETESVVMPVPETVTILMQQHIGAPCTPLVKKGERVLVGQKIADSDKPVSAPIHASVSGTVSELTEVMLPSGQTTGAIVIKTDGLQEPDPSIAPHPVNTRDELIAAVRESGMVGLGGAGFPTHFKLKSAEGADTLIINAAECEPYITADYREIMEHPDDIMDGVYLLLRLLELERVIIVIEDNKPRAVELLTAVAADKQDIRDQVYVMPVKSTYPRGAEKVTIQLATGRRVPPGKLPSDVGCLVMNITTVATIARYIKTGMPLVTRRVTVDGSAVANPMNVVVPVGTLVRDLIDFTGGYRCEPKKLIWGGPMMGISLHDDGMPILKQNNAILALSEKEAYPKPQTSCIRCGRCARACPMSLLPARVEGHLKAENLDAMMKDNVSVCIECGCCAFICPACRPLVQVMKQAKTEIRNQQRKESGR